MAKENPTIKDLAEKIDNLSNQTKNEFGKVKKEIRVVKLDLAKKIDQKIDGLALMTKKGFDGQDEKINFLIEQTKSVNKKQADHDFEITETVTRVEYHGLKERVDNLEEKIGIKK